MSTETGPLETDADILLMLSQGLSQTAASNDLDALGQTVVETLLRTEIVSAAEIVVFATGRNQPVVDVNLRDDGTRTPLFDDLQDNPILRAVLASGEPLLTPLHATGAAPDGNVSHVFALPLRCLGDLEAPTSAPLGVIILGFAEPPDLSPAFRHAIEILVRFTGDRACDIVAEQVRCRHVARMALIHEVGTMMVQPGQGEQVFRQAIHRIRETFGVDMAAVYAGDPLTLRLQCGGEAGQPGEPVPEGLAHQALRRQQPMVIDDLAVSRNCSAPTWAPHGVRSEVAIPLRYLKRRIGVLDLLSTSPVAFDHVDVEILAALAHQLAILIVQERWDHQAYTPGQLREAYDRLQEFSELKDQILQNVSHELRTPLTLIKGYLELMVEGQMGVLPVEQRESLQVVLNKVDDVVGIVDETVSLVPSSRFAVGYQKISVKTLFSEMAEVFANRPQGASITWDFQVDDDDLCLGGDTDKIRQICHNILENSVKFSPNGGRISVSAVSEQTYVHLIFSDEGVGIPKPRLTQIFETFYQVDGSSTRRFGGLGLGLAVVSRAVEAHKGKVWAESDLGKGSVFHVLLPKYEASRRILGLAPSGTASDVVGDGNLGHSRS